MKVGEVTAVKEQCRCDRGGAYRMRGSGAGTRGRREEVANGKEAGQALELLLLLKRSETKLAPERKEQMANERVPAPRHDRPRYHGLCCPRGLMDSNAAHNEVLFYEGRSSDA